MIALIEETIAFSDESLNHKLAFSNHLFAGNRRSIGSEKVLINIIMAINKKVQMEFILGELKYFGIDFICVEIGKMILLPVEKTY